MKIIKSIQRSEFVKNLATLISGTAVAQLIAIGIQPVIRRLYSPEDFGAFAVYISIVGIIVVVTSLRYDQSIVLPKIDNDSKNLVVLSLVLTFFISIIVFIIVLIFAVPIMELFKFPQGYSNWFYLLPFSIFFHGFYQSINYWFIRKKAYKSSSINKLSRRLTEGIVQVGFGLKKISFGLPVGDILGNLANSLSGIYQIRRKNFDLKEVSIKKIKMLASKYSEFPKYNLFPALLNTLSLSMPVFIINEFYTREITGYYDLTRLVLALPFALITISFSQVLYQHIVEKKNSNQLILKGLKNQFYYLFILALVALIIIVLLGPLLFSFVFGKEWNIAGEMARILVFSFAIKFIVSPFSIVLIALEKIKLTAVWQFFYFIIISSLFFLKNVEVFTILKMIVLVDLISYGIYFLIIYYISYQYDNKLVKKKINDFKNE